MSSTALYTRLAATATRLLSSGKFGGPVPVVRVSGQVINPVTGVVTPGTTTTLTANGLLKKYPDDLIDGTRIKQSDRLLVLDSTFEPVMTDKPTIGGQNWSIVSIETINPTSVAVVYFVQVRR